MPVLPGQPNPMIANGVAIGANVLTYKTSGFGPSALNTAAPAGSEARYIETAVFPAETLPPGVTITEAQGINARRIGENLQAAGLSYQDVYTMRVFAQNPAGAQAADFAGWNRAYRKYFRQHRPDHGQAGAGAARFGGVGGAVRGQQGQAVTVRLEIENLPVAGWLVEVEVDAAYPTAPGK